MLNDLIILIEDNYIIYGYMLCNGIYFNNNILSNVGFYLVMSVLYKYKLYVIIGYEYEWFVNFEVIFCLVIKSI